MSSNDAKGASPDIMKINTAAGVPEAWLKMQESTRMMNKAMMPDVSKMFPDMSKYAMPVLTDSTMNRMAELSKKMADVAALSIPTADLDRMQKLVTQATGLESVAKQISDNHAAISKMLDMSIATPKMLGFDDQFQKSIAAMTSTLTTTIDTSRLQDILATASAFKEEFAEQDIDELADEFFDNHPELAGSITESIEESGALYALNKTDRALIIWFVRICVTLTVACVMLNIDAELPELQRIIDALGLGGGWAAGKKAEELTGKTLDKLPQEEAE